PTLSDTSTARPSTVALRQPRRNAANRSAAAPSESNSTAEERPHAHVSAASRSPSENDRTDVGSTSPAGGGSLGPAVACSPPPTGCTSGIGSAPNALGRSHAAAGTTYEPASATTQAQRVARPARWRARSSASPTTTNRTAMATQYSIQAAIMASSPGADPPAACAGGAAPPH